MRVRKQEEMLRENLKNIGWEGKNLKENLSFYTQGENEELEVIKFDYSIYDEENCIAVLYDTNYDENTFIREREKFIQNLNLHEIPFLILINENMELLLINTKTKNAKRVEIEEISYKKLQERVQADRVISKTYEVEV